MRRAKVYLFSITIVLALTACGNSDGGSSSLSQLTNSGSLSSLISQLESIGKDSSGNFTFNAQ